MALVIGGLVGIEREFRTGIGLRTMMLICLGATMFTLYGEEYGLLGNDPSRVSAAVLTGVGFLGAGMILRHRAGVFGFTAATTVWLVAALGMGIGIGEYGSAFSSRLPRSSQSHDQPADTGPDQ
jgi:putative Mg2+ transporter-C (MgtC) family protein